MSICLCYSDSRIQLTLYGIATALQEALARDAGHPAKLLDHALVDMDYVIDR